MNEMNGYAKRASAIGAIVTVAMLVVVTVIGVVSVTFGLDAPKLASWMALSFIPLVIGMGLGVIMQIWRNTHEKGRD